MSDTAAFLAGCAVTGAAVLFLARNDFAIGQAGLSPPYQPSSPTPEISTVPVSPPSVPPDDGRSLRMEAKLDQQQDTARTLTSQLQRQEDRTDDLKDQLERQQRETESLKDQLDRQQRNTELLISELQEQRRLLDRISDQPDRPPLVPIESPPLALDREDSESSSNVQTIVIGAAGVILVIIVAGGGILLVTIVIVALTSSRRRQARTVHIVHPFPTSYSSSSLPAHLMLPTRSRTRPARQVDVEYYDTDNFD